MLLCYLTSPISVALCPALTDPANGTVTWTGLIPGSTATYTCDEGFELNGVQNRTCQSDGTWSDVPPTCDRGVLRFGVAHVHTVNGDFLYLLEKYNDVFVLDLIS